MDYRITLQQITDLADAIAAADGHIPATSPDKGKVDNAHGILLAVLGKDEALVYGAPEMPSIVAAVSQAIKNSCDEYWTTFLPDGHALRNAHVDNRMHGNSGTAFRDAFKMRLCEKHGRMFQVGVV